MWGSTWMSTHDPLSACGRCSCSSEHGKIGRHTLERGAPTSNLALDMRSTIGTINSLVFSISRGIQGEVISRRRSTPFPLVSQDSLPRMAAYFARILDSSSEFYQCRPMLKQPKSYQTGSLIGYILYSSKKKFKVHFVTVWTKVLGRSVHSWALLTFVPPNV